MHLRSKFILVPLAFGALAALSPAPLLHKHRVASGPPATQEDLAKFQTLAKVVGQVGDIVIKPKRTPDFSQFDEEGGSDVAQVSNEMDEQHRANRKALNVLGMAGRKIAESHRSPLIGIFWLFFAGCFGYGVFFAFQKWADKNIPESKATR